MIYSASGLNLYSSREDIADRVLFFPDISNSPLMKTDRSSREGGERGTKLSRFDLLLRFSLHYSH